MMYKKRGDMMKMIRKNSIRLLTSAMLIGAVAFGLPGSAEVNWQEVNSAGENTVEINIPNQNTKYYQYTYTKPSNYTEATERINNTLNSDNVKDKLFQGLSSNSSGGAIYNSLDKSEVNITADFVNNSTSNYGGAIYNEGFIGNITANFINNTAPSGASRGGAINNYAQSGIVASINTVTGNFINNEANRGAAILNYAYSGMVNTTKINSISGAFINNVASGSGGAIFNEADGSSIAKIDSINADFVNNKSGKNGGAISNFAGATTATALLGDIKGSFVGNIATSNGGAIANISSSEIGNINADFKYNSSLVSGGAIHNDNSKIKDITGNFVSNSVTGDKAVLGGAIYNKKGTIGNIKGDFIGNTATSSSSYARGGAIYNIGEIGEIHGSFISNETSGYGESFGGVIYNDTNGKIQALKGNFVDNKLTTDATFRGGAIYNTNAYIGTIEGSFIRTIGYNTIGKYNSAGGAICNFNSTVIDSIKADFIENNITTPGLALGGAISNQSSSKIKYLEGNFISNGLMSLNSQAQGGAIYNSSIIDNIVNSSFIKNYTKSETGTAQGGAIYSSSPYGLNIIADNGVSTFSGNYTQVGDEKDDNAIYINTTAAPLNFQLKNGGRIIMKDNIRGQVSTTTETSEDGTETTIEKHYSVDIKGDDINKTSFYLHNDIYDANVTLGNTTLNTINDDVHTYNFHSLRLTDNTNMSVDVDLAKGEMDRFSAKEYGEHQGNLNVVGMNLLSDSQGETTEIMFAEAGLKDNVTNGTPSLPNKAYQTAYTPIYKYDINYDNRTDGGYFVFTRGGKNGGSDSFNPSVLSAPVSSVAASQATINETFKYVFEHADTFTQMPNSVRQAKLNANKYALSTDFNNNNGDLCKLCDSNNKAGWFKPYVTFENMNLKHGPKVDAITYGSLVGYDTDFRELKHGWHSVGTGYIGYNGSQLNYSGVDTTMNGGLLGYTETFYKNNFWTALTLSAGASVGESKTMYGKEDFTSLMAGVGSKTGYNFEFKEGKYILQPIMFMSYTFVNTFDYTNASGVKVKPSPAHSIQLNPSVRFIANTKNGWQPYASVGMVWNVMNENKVTANNVRLPEMGMKPYVEYGLGLQRNWKDKFTAYGQAMIRNGGRNGIALTGGMRWALGKEGKPIEKVQTDNSKIAQQSKTLNQVQSDRTRKVLKQLSPSQKTALGKSQNTTRTTNSAIIKSL